MARQLDLFATEPIPGLTCQPDVVPPGEEAALIAAIDAAGLTPFRFHQWTGNRLTASFGLGYDYGGRRLQPAAPMPAWLLPLRQRAAEACGLSADQLVQALLTRYDPGAGIGWHRDKPEFGEVVGVSLGNPVTLRFRRREEGGFRRESLHLAPRSVYRLSGEARRVWEHSIAPVTERRWSVTFRTLA